MYIYLDTNVYCRPFDDQEQERVREETDSFEKILHDVRSGKVTLISSDILLFEIYRILSPVKKAEVEKYLILCKKRVSQDEEIKEKAVIIKYRCKISDRDALHLASAIVGGAKYFLTCDDEVTTKKNAECIKKVAKEHGKNIIIINPKRFNKGD